MNLPHDYTVNASVQPESLVTVSAAGLPDIESGPPTQFGGTGEQWSPEDLIVAAVADCFVLAFRAIAAASKFEWSNLECSARGTLDKVERAVQFTELTLTAKLTVPTGADASRAERLLDKAKQTCFITNSMKSETKLEFEIVNA